MHPGCRRGIGCLRSTLTQFFCIAPQITNTTSEHYSTSVLGQSSEHEFAIFDRCDATISNKNVFLKF
jgi:hypothetical protein